MRRWFVMEVAAFSSDVDASFNNLRLSGLQAVRRPYTSPKHSYTSLKYRVRRHTHDARSTRPAFSHLLAAYQPVFCLSTCAHRPRSTLTLHAPCAVQAQKSLVSSRYVMR